MAPSGSVAVTVMQAACQYYRGERGEQCERDRALGAVLAPDKPGH
jgi:hypothetical protein